LIARGVPARLDVVGRLGWGDHGFVEAAKDVATFHGFLPEEDGRRVIANADLYLCASHDEGLGLPLLEVQHGGLPVVAPNRAPFTETMRAGAILVDTTDPDRAAGAIAATIAEPGRLAALGAEAAGNVARWNEAANADRAAFRAMLDRAGVARR
jgi:glycosyltransferase involved in cell wall biosynthesis